MMAAGFSFASHDMEYYPPGPETGLYRACRIFQKEGPSPLKKTGIFFQLLNGDEEFAEEYPRDDDDLTPPMNALISWSFYRAETIL